MNSFTWIAANGGEAGTVMEACDGNTLGHWQGVLGSLVSV